MEVYSNDEKTETFPKYFNEKVVYKKQNFYILLEFVSINIELLIVVSIYYYLIKYRAKQKHLLPFHITNTLIII